jgi:hypothetical protein
MYRRPKNPTAKTLSYLPSLSPENAVNALHQKQLLHCPKSPEHGDLPHENLIISKNTVNGEILSDEGELEYVREI